MNALLPPPSPHWFCLRTRSRHEHIAGNWLRLRLGIETYAPRIRFRRLEPRGPVWAMDAVFPNYLFARFDLTRWLRQVEAAPGVRGVVRFGPNYPWIQDEIIEDLRLAFGQEQIRVVDDPPRPGDTVQLACRSFHGLQALVTRVLPQRQRVLVLLDFLGRQTTVDLPCSAITRPAGERPRLASWSH